MKRMTSKLTGAFVMLLLCAAAAMMTNVQTQSKVSFIYGINNDGLLNQHWHNGAAADPNHPWGRLANPGYQNHAIKTTLFFAGRPLDGTGSANPNDPFFNGAGPSATAQGCYSVHPSDERNLNWVDPRNPSSEANRQYVLQSMIDDGLNVVSMSTWGESWLPSTTDCTSYVTAEDCGAPCSATNRSDCCSDSDSSKCIPRCSHGFAGARRCRIGWFGAAPMQVSTLAKDQLFSAAVGRPLLILPFIESRFDVDWDFDDEFPTSTDGRTAPLLISQIEDLISHYLRNRAHPEWAGKWARVYDQNGVERYAVVIAHAASQRLDLNDRDSDRKFAEGFDAVANKVFEDTGGVRGGGVRIGFFLDIIPRSPTSSFGCPGIDPTKLTSLYRADRVFKPDAVSTGPYLRQQASMLGIHSYMPEGWVDVKPEANSKVNECFRIAWKEEFSRQWFKTGIPFLQDVSAGYDGSLLFKNRQPVGWGLTKWGYNRTWFAVMNQLVRDYGENGMVYNAWNGYCEGLAGMETVGDRLSTAELPRALTSIHPQPVTLGRVPPKDSQKVTPFDKKPEAAVENALEGIKNADAEQTFTELRCRGGDGLHFVVVKGRTTSSGEQTMYMTVDFQHAAQPAGSSGRNLQPGQCAFADRALRTDEPDQIIQEIVSFGQLKEKLHGSAVDTSPTAAERFPDAKNVPQYLSDAKHYWSFYVRQNGPLPSGRFESSYGRYWKPFLSLKDIRPNPDGYKQPKRVLIPGKP
jgi:hypothetical protein